MIKVGILSAADVRVTFIGSFAFINPDSNIHNLSKVCLDKEGYITGTHVFSASNMLPGTYSCIPTNSATNLFCLPDVTIGINFHWQRKEAQSFKGTLIIHNDGKTLTVINSISIEEYLESVIASEMSANASLEFLKAHAIISRTWVINRIIQRKRKESLPQRDNNIQENQATIAPPDERIRWYDDSEHILFDVCADDHCQRYQGISRISNANAAEAVRSTEGIVLTYKGEIIDARFAKCCGGAFEEFGSCWTNTQFPYLHAGRDYIASESNIDKDLLDTDEPLPDLTQEDIARKWIIGRPKAFCNTHRHEVLRQILNNFDLETPDFYRWKVEYSASEISRIVKERTDVDFGEIIDMIPLQRGVSGRIVRLKIIGTHHTMIIGKELEIRRTLSRSHLYSSAFTVNKIFSESDPASMAGNDLRPAKFVLHGAGWGHGVGLCQIGAAMMADKGYTHSEILSHYYPGCILTVFSKP